MLVPRNDPFPFQAVRDLLGILRAMYAATRADGRSPQRLEAIRRLGHELRAATELALEHQAGSLGHAAAWQRAERAAQRLGDLVDCTTPLEPTVEAAARRLRPPRGADGRAARRRARSGRG